MISPILGTGLFDILLSGIPQTLQTLQVIVADFGYPQEIDKTLLLKITYLTHGTWRKQAGTDLETSSIRTSFHSAARFYAQCKDKSNQQSYPDINLSNCTHNYSGTICPLVQRCHECYGSDCSESNEKDSPQNPVFEHSVSNGVTLCRRFKGMYVIGGGL